jgi:6-phosphogluconolactonase (cycloisomerase 2 family)
MWTFSVIEGVRITDCGRFPYVTVRVLNLMWTFSITEGVCIAVSI